MWVIGTAGHIDHGKSALVRALTGVEPDRLPEERARGITIELGFAPLDLGDGVRAHVIDVPGHERFVETMVAGATGIDLALLVVAADDGVMPQTREHLAICALLGVGALVAVVSKIDAAPPAMADACADEVAALLAETPYAGAPLVRVSARAGVGLDELRAVVRGALAGVQRAASAAPTRLPIDRVFTVKGAGTVVTGTLRGAPLAVGDELVALPSGARGRVRTLHQFGQACARVDAPARVAVNLDGVAVADLARGQILARPGEVEASHLLDVRVRAIAGARLARRMAVHVGHGATSVPGTLTLAGGGDGADALAQLRFGASHALAALPGDRFILRRDGVTLGGGEVLRPLAARRRARRPDVAGALVDAAAAARLLVELIQAGAAGRSQAELVPRLGLAPAEVGAALEAARAAGDVVLLGGRWLAATVVAQLEASVRAAVASPRSVAELRAHLPLATSPAVRKQLIDALLARGALATDDGGATVRLPTTAPVATAGAPIEAALRTRFAALGLAPPKPSELAAEVATQVGVPAREASAAITRLLAARALVKVNPDYVVAAAAYDDIKARLLAMLAAHGEVSTAAWKELTGVSRKHAIALAEHFDAAHVTRRVGDVRRRW
jgi:selenocysteine-specific elongation factor